MLSRLAIRTLRAPALQGLGRTTAPRQTTSLLASRTWTRGMAKNNKPSPTPSQQTSKSNAPSEEQAASLPPKQSENATKPEASDAQPEQVPFNLPDLTKGLPSTFEYEASGADKASKMALEGVTSAGGRGKGELPASAYVSSSDRRRQKVAQWVFYGFVAGGIFGVVFLGRNWEDEEERAKHADVPDGWTPGLWWKRAMARMGDTVSYYQEPAFEKLLPDPDPVNSPPYTLCISLEDLLVHSEWTRDHGWRVAKRPGVDYFIRYLSQYYELVLFTSVPYGIAEPLWRKMDPFRFVQWPLFREATKYVDGKIVKDLSYLNRDLSKVIIIDTNPEHVSAQPENAIILPKWTGDAQDKDLVALIPFLEYIHTMQYPDVRKVLKSFEGKNIAEEFVRREAIARKKFQEQLEQNRKKHPNKPGSGVFGALGSAFGLKPSKMSMMVPVEGEESVADALAQGKMLQDIARERGQRQYERIDKMVRENGEKWLKEEAEMMEKMQAEAMANMKTGFMGWFGSSEKKEEAKDEPKKA
ncbi:hypothetical protein MCOR25_000281 [Pyricularia grisea]|uniref:Mitochondrial import inner membrane translocase subunit TIM50 n=1 Tax=Pyricularia grisea TaxID=148305 RepID=A0A6P8AP61_PYRGI|nr:hypothetical protein PgNI_11450 [Pyricularia grisea]KAI6383093.1 hypothetical protein MCOR25_000281 [Pyricularia grisea]TLD03820.1 hypothetical protein PgNI_11450 [Pyricularia grisea]